jgi:hypothetical protein
VVEPRALLKHKHLVGFESLIAEQIDAAHFHAFRQIVLPETSGIGAGPSGGDFAAPGNGFDHALDVVIAAGRFLSLMGAEDSKRTCRGDSPGTDSRLLWRDFLA